MGKKNRKAKSTPSEVKNTNKVAKKVTAVGDKLANSKGLNKKKRSKGSEPKEPKNMFFAATLIAVAGVAIFLVVQNYPSLSESSVRPLYRILANDEEDLNTIVKSLDILEETKDIVTVTEEKDSNDKLAEESKSNADGIEKPELDSDDSYAPSSDSKLPEGVIKELKPFVESSESLDIVEEKRNDIDISHSMNDENVDSELEESLPLQESEEVLMENLDLSIDESDSVMDTEEPDKEQIGEDISSNQPMISSDERENEEVITIDDMSNIDKEHEESLSILTVDEEEENQENSRSTVEPEDLAHEPDQAEKFKEDQDLAKTDDEKVSINKDDENTVQEEEEEKDGGNDEHEVTDESDELYERDDDNIIGKKDIKNKQDERIDTNEAMKQNLDVTQSNSASKDDDVAVKNEDTPRVDDVVEVDEGECAVDEEDCSDNALKDDTTDEEEEDDDDDDDVENDDDEDEDEEDEVDDEDDGVTMITQEESAMPKPAAETPVEINAKLYEKHPEAETETEHEDEGFIDVTNGVKKRILKAGTGETIDAGDLITIECIGYLDSDPPKKFWSTKDPSQKPFTFAVGRRQVIKGWDEGALSMSLHERSRIKIEPKKAYGKFGFEAWGIPPGAGIIFEIEVVEHKRMKTR